MVRSLATFTCTKFPKLSCNSDQICLDGAWKSFLNHVFTCITCFNRNHFWCAQNCQTNRSRDFCCLCLFIAIVSISLFPLWMIMLCWRMAEVTGIHSKGHISPSFMHIDREETHWHNPPISNGMKSFIRKSEIGSNSSDWYVYMKHFYLDQPFSQNM